MKQRNMTFFSGQEWIFQQDSVPAQKAKATQEWLWSNFLAFISAENWLSGSADLKTVDCGLFWRSWCAESITTAWRAWGDPREAAAEIPLETGRVAAAEWRSISRLASRHRAAMLSDIIINENLKLLQINYLAWKVDIFFRFSPRSLCTCNRTYGKT